jgi:hypothetical protein
MRGRPRIFVTQAEKQKAYRERKRNEGALRNSPAEILPETPTVDCTLLALWEQSKTYEAKHNQLSHMPFYGDEWEAFGGFDEWHRQLNANLDLCWKADAAFYAAWKAAGYPAGPWKQ